MALTEEVAVRQLYISAELHAQKNQYMQEAVVHVDMLRQREAECMTAVNNVQQQALQYKESLDAQSEQAVAMAAATHAVRLREEAQAAVLDETAKRVEVIRKEALSALEAEKNRMRAEFIAERAALQHELTASQEAEQQWAQHERQLMKQAT